MSDAGVIRIEPGRLRERIHRLGMPIERALQQSRKIAKAARCRPSRPPARAGPAPPPRCRWPALPGRGLPIDPASTALAPYNPASAPGVSASIAAAIAWRSTGSRSGRQTSKMRTTRSASLGFIASCSMVSSKTNASPSRQYRVSPPTRNQQPSRHDQRQVAHQPRVVHSDVRAGSPCSAREARTWRWATRRAPAVDRRIAKPPAYAGNDAHWRRPDRRSATNGSRSSRGFG